MEILYLLLWSSLTKNFEFRYLCALCRKGVTYSFKEALDIALLRLSCTHFLCFSDLLNTIQLIVMEMV